MGVQIFFKAVSLDGKRYNMSSEKRNGNWFECPLCAHTFPHLIQFNSHINLVSFFFFTMRIYSELREVKFFPNQLINAKGGIQTYMYLTPRFLICPGHHADFQSSGIIPVLHAWHGDLCFSWVFFFSHDKNFKLLYWGMIHM